SHTSIGFIAVAVAVIFFGSNIVPVKNTDTGDGMFYQWIMCSAIWQTGLVVHLVRDNPTFHPSAMIGGMLWATGNVTVIPIIKTIGLGLGMLLWGTVNLASGWASGHFGLFGLDKDKIDDQALNYVGFALALVSVFLFLFVKPEVSDAPSQEEEREHFIPTNVNHYEPIRAHINNDSSWVDKLTPIQKRITGSVLSVIAGCLYGFNFVPCLWIQDNVKDASQNGLDYVFSHFCGIYLTSTCYFALYCILMRNRPRLFQCLVLPSIVSGVMWGIAQSAWFVANAYLTESVSFPLIATCPGVIGAAWSVFYFREIRGWKNYLVLIVACCVTATSATLTALSKNT
ncbi:transmembrane protein 144-like, partial [Amphiura filiformis]|uniref:transmembrane protein 144-like n=1 Tax=Amphiura filiformis TaxID=82378 RepID=UPI003B21FF30